MKLKLSAILAISLLVPVFAYASFDPLAWLKTIKITTYTKPKAIAVSTTTASTTGSLIDPIRYGMLAGAAAALSPDKEQVLNDQIAQMKSDNDSLKRTVASLQQKISSLTNQYATDLASCQQNVNQAKSIFTPQNLNKIKSLEFNISGDMDDNFRNKIDENGEITNEKVLNIQFFRDGQTASNFQDEIKQYDSLMGTNLVGMAQKFLNAIGDGVPEFQSFYDYFQSVRKFPK